MINTARYTSCGKGAKIIPSLIVMVLATTLWNVSTPDGLTENAWQLLVIFLSTIFALVIKPLPNGAISFIAIVACLLTKTLDINQVLNSFSNSVVWLIVAAFFIAMGFKNTGLGRRIAYYLMYLIGKNNIGLAYGFVMTEFILSPFIPSSAARGAGVIFPILSSLLDKQEKKVKSFLVKVCFQANLVTSAIFVTSFAGNPIIVNIAKSYGINITWNSWMIATIVPGIINLLVLPLIVYLIYKPTIRNNYAKDTIHNNIKKLGPMTGSEKNMVLVFTSILTLWIMGDEIGITATGAAFVGVAIMIILGVIQWEDCTKESAAWEIMFWFAPILMITSGLIKLSVPEWFVSKIGLYQYSNVAWYYILIPTILIYFYVHYMFASIVTKIAAFYSSFLTVLLHMGTPPMIAAMSLAITSSLAGSLTNFSTGSAPVYFGMGHISTKNWISSGFVISSINLLIWLISCVLWWQVIGYWG